MLLDPRAPLAAGTLVILALAGYLALRDPQPRELAAAHGRVPELAAPSGCRTCHAPEGLATGCLGCHGEIASQITSELGYHGALATSGDLECRECHPEHLGAGFSLVGPVAWKSDPEAFDHHHVKFELSGRHGELDCAGCHREELAGTFALPRFASLVRERSYLGLTQECSRCHEDIHARGLSGACDSCHSQDAFRPAHFDHARFLPLLGGHERLECGGCHLLPHPPRGESPPFAFDQVRGTTCAECHPSPHIAPFPTSCDDCHPAASPEWSAAGARLTAEIHALTGFPLAPPHAGVGCEKCHLPGGRFEERYPDPAGPGYLRSPETCQGCHEDVHQGQFTGRYSGCLSCHERTRFLPHRFGRREHQRAYPLLGLHGAVLCTGCHRPQGDAQHRRFTGTSSRCADCHADPHGGQFHEELAAGDCDTCHDGEIGGWPIRPFDHLARAGYALEGAHSGAACADCHREAPLFAGAVRRYRGTPAACDACHRDPHGGQFATQPLAACERCHASAADWRELAFDHARDTAFPLSGSHEGVPCRKCHPEVARPGGERLVQYRPTGKECQDCHSFARR